jgi:hypothetical protein
MSKIGYLINLMSSVDQIDQNVIVRHHNGDICNNIKNWVKIDHTGLVIANEWAFKQKPKEFGVTGTNIKWLKTAEKPKPGNEMPAYVSFPAQNMFDNEFDALSNRYKTTGKLDDRGDQNSKLNQALKEMVYIHANQSSEILKNLYEDEEMMDKAKSIVNVPKIRQNEVNQIKNSKDTIYNPSFRSKKYWFLN